MFCSKCGNELMDEAVVCTKCGCLVGQPNKQPRPQKNVTTVTKIVEADSTKSGWIPLTLGILALISTVINYLFYILADNLLFTLTGVCSAAGLGCCALLAIITGIKHLSANIKVLPILGLAFGGVSLVANVVYTILLYSELGYFVSTLLEL